MTRTRPRPDAPTHRSADRPGPAQRTSTRPALSRLLVVALATLVVTDVVGGLWAVAAGVNTLGDAWGSGALLAAPLPMIAAQVLLTAAAVRLDGLRGAVPAGLVSLACLVSVASGFFDGGLGNDRLTAAMSAFQAVLLGVTFVVGLLAAARAVQAAGRR